MIYYLNILENLDSPFLYKIKILVFVVLPDNKGMTLQNNRYSLRRQDKLSISIKSIHKVKGLKVRQSHVQVLQQRFSHILIESRSVNNDHMGCFLRDNSRCPFPLKEVGKFSKDCAIAHITHVLGFLLDFMSTFFGILKSDVNRNMALDDHVDIIGSIILFYDCSIGKETLHVKLFAERCQLVEVIFAYTLEAWIIYDKTHQFDFFFFRALRRMDKQDLVDSFSVLIVLSYLFFFKTNEVFSFYHLYYNLINNKDAIKEASQTNY